MRGTIHINPDHFLQAEHDRVITPERNKLAWSQCYEVFARELSIAGAAAKVYVLVGPQGAGKSTWARAFAVLNPDAIIFDAIWSLSPSPDLSVPELFSEPQ